MSCKGCGGRCVCDPAVPKPPPVVSGGDVGWLELLDVLRELHVRKAGTYGTDEDALANYVQTSRLVGQVDEFTPMLRITEKLERARNMVLSGRGLQVREWMDIAALALGCEALRVRREKDLTG